VLFSAPQAMMQIRCACPASNANINSTIRCEAVSVHALPSAAYCRVASLVYKQVAALALCKVAAFATLFLLVCASLATASCSVHSSSRDVGDQVTVCLSQSSGLATTFCSRGWARYWVWWGGGLATRWAGPNPCVCQHGNCCMQRT
jgi:hypothetical protein